MQIKLNFMEPKTTKMVITFSFFLWVERFELCFQWLRGCPNRTYRRHKQTHTHQHIYIIDTIRIVTHTHTPHTHALCVQFSNGPISCFLPLTFIIIYFIYHICISIYVYTYISTYVCLLYQEFSIYHKFWPFFFRFYFEFRLKKKFFAQNKLHPKSRKCQMNKK